MLVTEIKLNAKEHEKFCKAMHKKLKKRKMTVRDFAPTIGVAEKSIYNFEKDTTKNPSRYLAAKIANELGITSDEYRSKGFFTLWFLPIVGLLLFGSKANAQTIYVYDTDIPLSYDQQMDIQKICNEYDVCYELVLAIAERESRFTPDAVNGACLGMCQLNKNYFDVEDFYDPVQNAEGCIKYLRDLFDELNDDGYVLDRYHGDSKAKYRYENGLMSKYAKGILERSAELERKHGK